MNEWLRQAAPLHCQAQVIIEFSVYLAATLIVIRRLINRTRTVYRWPHPALGTAPVIPRARPGRSLPPFW